MYDRRNTRYHLRSRCHFLDSRTDTHSIKVVEENLKDIEKEEKEFLKYIVRCCENMIENPEMKKQYGLIPPMLQLYKMRSEVNGRLEELK